MGFDIHFVLGIRIGDSAQFLYALSNVLNEQIGKICDKLDLLLLEKLVEKSIRLEYAETENVDTMLKYERAKEAIELYSGGYNSFVRDISSILASTIQLISIIIIISSFSGVLVILSIFLAFLSLKKYIKTNRYEVKKQKLFSKNVKEFEYYMFRITDIKYAKDIRLNNAKEIISKKLRAFIENTIMNYKDIYKKTLPYNMEIQIMDLLQNFIAFFIVSAVSIKKAYGVGTFTMLSSAITNFYLGISLIVKSTSNIYKSMDYLKDYISFVNKTDTSTDTLELQPSFRKCLEFKNVSFKYPNSDCYVLRNVSIVIKKGEKVALVGMNGSGKTTLMLLLCRFFDDYDGEILLDGIDIRAFNKIFYQETLSAVFQDFKLFAFSVKENLCLNKQINEEILYSALNKVEMLHDIDKLPLGIDTILFKYFDESGIEMSGGQQQKLAIVRALLQNPQILILDEPASAMDPLLENHIFNTLQVIAKDQTTIFITHRMISTKYCDKIFVINSGQIAETGTHSELIECQGLYAQMYELQTDKYNF